MRLPEGVACKNNWICKLNTTLCVSKQGERYLFETFEKALIGKGSEIPQLIDEISC